MTELWLGLFSGIFFGFVIQRVGASDANEMAKAHLMLNGRIPKFMLVAVIFSAVGLYGLQVSGIDHTRVLPTSVVATGIAAILFGLGWGACGYCPGTTWAAVGEGRIDAVFALLGGLAGSAVFAHFHAVLIPLLYSPTNIGQVALTDIVYNRAAAVLILVAVFSLCIWAIDRVCQQRRQHEA